MGLGDAVSEALAAVGITPEAVTRWLGEPCGCEERKAKLNALGVWAARVVSGKVRNARGYLLGILEASD